MKLVFCRHQVTFRRLLDKPAWEVVHGGGEARRIFSDYELRTNEKESSLLQDWVNEVHAYEAGVKL